MSALKIASKRNKSIILIFVSLIFGITHRIIEANNDSPQSFILWHFVTALSFGVFTISYLASIKCPSVLCKARQVFRGVNVFEFRLPSNNCYKCGCDLDKDSDRSP